MEKTASEEKPSVQAQKVLQLRRDRGYEPRGLRNNGHGW